LLVAAALRQATYCHNPKEDRFDGVTISARRAGGLKMDTAGRPACFLSLPPGHVRAQRFVAAVHEGRGEACSAERCLGDGRAIWTPGRTIIRPGGRWARAPF